MADAPGVGIVLVSHSRLLAEGAAEMVAQIAGDDVAVVGVGGTDDGQLGTSIDALERAIGEADAGAGVVVIPDIGSSVLTTRAYLAENPADTVVLVDTAFVEGAVAAAVTASTGAPLAAVIASAEEARGLRKL